MARRRGIGRIARHAIPDDLRTVIARHRDPGGFADRRDAVYETDRGRFSNAPLTRHRCIFVRVTKTAGVSVNSALFDTLIHHYTARQYYAMYGARVFRSYYRFAFVRNPWDRLYSAWSYLSGGGWDRGDEAWFNAHLGHLASFEEFVLDWLTPVRLGSHKHLWPQSRFLCDRFGEVMADFVGRFEHLERDFHRVARILGIDASLPHRNASHRRDYREVYTPAMQEKVGHLYSRDIALFGYVFDNGAASGDKGVELQALAFG